MSEYIEQTTREYRCPIHDMTDCSPLLNGCVLPRRKAKLHDALIAVAARTMTPGEALSMVEEYADRVYVAAMRAAIDRTGKGNR